MVVILYKHHVSRHFEDGWTPKNRVDSAGRGGHLHEDLRVLIEHCRRDWKEAMSIARVVCNENDVRPTSEIGSGWYVALTDIPSAEGFMPLEDAEKKYLGRP